MTAAPPRPPWWLLLLPLSFLLHIVEETWAGEGFVAWTGRLFPSPITAARFTAISTIGWVVFACLTLVAVLRPGFAWLAATLPTLLLVNALLHLLGTVVTAAYSPGLVTSLVIYPPICIAALRYSRSKVPPSTFAMAVGAGVVLHILVLVVAFLPPR